MSLDINVFRTIAAKPDGNQLLYVQGAELKSTTAQKSGGSAQFDEFKAATKAFLDSFKAHYGAALGQTASNTLREYVEMGRPLSASVVSQLITFADKFVKDNLGSGRCVKVGDAVVDLAKLGTDKLLSTGYSQSTQRTNAEKGAARAAADIFRATALEEDDFELLMREHKEMNAGLAGNLELKSGRIPDKLEDAIRLHVRRVYEKYGENLTRAAEALDVSRNTVRKYL